ncbi:MAG: LysE family translocator [Porticoccaceae bacterium]|nr:LysE family translocator [Porticoccaceae bacterium]
MDYYLSVITFTFVAGITPGPNNMMLLASGLNHGIRKSIPHYLGICIGFPVMVAVMGFGLGALFKEYPSIYIYIKVSGIIYLLYLAWKIGNAGNPNASSRIRQPLTFIQAAAFQWLNPKAWVIAVGALAAFTAPDNMVQTVATVIFVYFVMGFICMAFWLKLGEGLQLFLQSGKRLQSFNIAMALLLALSVVPMAITG